MRSARQICFIYYIGASAILVIFYILSLANTIQKGHQLTTQNNIHLLKDIAQTRFEKSMNQTHINLTPDIDFFIDELSIPSTIKIPSNAAPEQLIKLSYDSKSHSQCYFYRTTILLNNVEHQLYIIYSDIHFDSTQSAIIKHQSILMLPLLAFFFVTSLLFTQRLVRPITTFSQELDHLTPGQPINIESNFQFQATEFFLLKQHFQRYQKKIQELIQRERSFNRYASHELRTPLTIIQGALQLLKVSDSLENRERQEQRILQASNDMNDFIEALLALTKNKIDYTPRILYQDEIETILKNYLHLQLQDVICTIEMKENITCNIPQPVFSILLGNLIRNAFLYTETGKITIVITQEKIEVIDTGLGITLTKTQSRGFGLGLLLVQDICHQYNYHFSLTENQSVGCTATVNLI